MDKFNHPLFDEVFYSRSLPSTNKKAETLIRSGSDPGNFLVFSDLQTGGIGRKDNIWYSPPEGIWMTVALYSLPFKSGLTIFTGICIHKAILDYLTTDLRLEIPSDCLKIKWPNDIYWKDKKVCGILSNYLDNWKYHIIGVGINTNNNEFPPQLKDTAAALKSIYKHNIDNQILMKRIFDRIREELPAFIEDALDLDYYNKNSLLIHRNIELDTDFDKFSGESLGINKSGALILKLDSGMIQPFYSGTITSWT